MVANLGGYEITLGTVRHEWCDECNLSTGFSVDLFHINEQGVRKIGTYHSCERCGEGPT